MTDVVRVAPDHPDPIAIARAADCLRRGGLVAFPTETVYGLGVNALDREAVRRLFEAKQRPATDPLIVHIGSIDLLPPLVSQVPDSVRVLGRHFWPGPLTLVLPRSPQVPDEVTAGLSTVAIRVPRHPVALALLEAAAIPVAAPSANLFSRPSPTQAAHVIEDLDGRIDLVLDGGATTVGVESTVLDLTADVPAVLRPGAVTHEMLQELLGRVDTVTGSGIRDPGLDQAKRSPGMLEKHYSPRAPLTLYEGASDAVLAAVVDEAESLASSGHAIGVIVADEDQDALTSNASQSRILVRTIGRRNAPDAVAARLYSTLRELDATGVERILVGGFPEGGLWTAVRDRLRRAAAGRIVRV
jgi:L-threonylcarbamoyladenylate synthase